MIGVVWDEVARSRRDRERLLDGPRPYGDDEGESGRPSTANRVEAGASESFREANGFRRGTTGP
ncbi:hypothetical protein I7X12_09400 [Halosimplex litoreum]|uniref:Uncharacterized protein n=1 Tax=Halosimplex litoreum TaxID=1198301 RepID=A0A7U3WB00_9EURY|nr:hypothetical protein [Halosimplex litoreum]QPV64795.1 hypothetical protein I7X12_09400 [Halosimplex litoreum]